MQLIGVPNSPYFRRTAISLELLGVPFEVVPLSPFMDVQALGTVNPVMKVPTLVCDNGEQIMDSSLIVQYAEAALANGQSLWPTDAAQLQTDFRVVSLALAALEKCLQIIYETRLRPEDTRHAPWLDRIQGQCRAAFTSLEQAIVDQVARYETGSCQAGITSAVAWSFAAKSVGDDFNAHLYPLLAEFSGRMELTPVFKKYA